MKNSGRGEEAPEISGAGRTCQRGSVVEATGRVQNRRPSKTRSDCSIWPGRARDCPVGGRVSGIVALTTLCETTSELHQQTVSTQGAYPPTQWPFIRRLTLLQSITLDETDSRQCGEIGDSGSCPATSCHHQPAFVYTWSVSWCRDGGADSTRWDVAEPCPTGAHAVLNFQLNRWRLFLPMRWIWA
jgi:hypothetical protein